MLQAESDEMLQAWIAALQKGIGAAIQHDTNPNRGLESHIFRNSPSHQSHKKVYVFLF